MEIFQRQPRTDAALSHLCGLVDIQFARAVDREAADSDEILLQRAQQWMWEHVSRQASMPELAEYLGVSITRLHRLFQAGSSTSPGAFYHDLKMKHAARLLTRSGYTVKRVAYEIGYGHANDFSRAFRSYFGHPPSRQMDRV
jgi:transcriptional regulator GlxA family with amidase domain